MEELRYDIRVTLHKKWEMYNTFKQTLTSTLNEKNLVNPLSTLNVNNFYIKSNIFILRTPKCKISTLSVKKITLGVKFFKIGFTLRVATQLLS